MKKNTVVSSELRSRLLTALAKNRVAKLNFPGMLMGLRGEQRGDSSLALHYDDGAWARNAAGEVHWPVLGVLLDVALGAVTRLKTGPTHRPATVQLQVTLTGAPIQHAPVAQAHFVADTQRSAARHALTRATLTSGDAVVAHASASFVMLELQSDAMQQVLPWPARDLVFETVGERDLHAHERMVLRHFDRAQRVADAEHPFIERFWAGVPERRERGARLSVAVAPHLGNRIGQVHGGILFGLAAHVASTAAPAGMRLSNLDAWFTSPGQGKRLTVRSDVLHAGRNLAVVRTQITAPGGVRVLETTSQHLRVLH
ncbi:MAG TPA: acyl-CoA thioesterase domain-containing protein [Burkholderiales bacterium]|nr:acyl-CoA thioesterase domain-containing protein [Burkholderiales bacterium]